MILPGTGRGTARVASGGGGSSPTLRKPEVYNARRARRAMSLPEVLLWQRLKGSPEGVSFRRQHPIHGYRADFYCAAARLILEVDGSAHDMGDRPRRDEARTELLAQKGYSVLRLLATDILRDPDEAAQSVIAFARSSPGRGGGPAKPVEGVPHLAERVENPLHHSPVASGPPPRPGEDHHA